MNVIDDWSLTPLHRAVMHVELASGDPDGSKRRKAWRDRLDVIRQLLEAGADPDVRGMYGELPRKDPLPHGWLTALEYAKRVAKQPGAQRGDLELPAVFETS